MTPTGIEPVLLPWKGGVLAAWPRRHIWRRKRLELLSQARRRAILNSFNRLIALASSVRSRGSIAWNLISQISATEQDSVGGGRGIRTPVGFHTQTVFKTASLWPLRYSSMLVGESGFEPLKPKQRIYSPPLLTTQELPHIRSGVILPLDTLQVLLQKYEFLWTHKVNS